MKNKMKKVAAMMLVGVILCGSVLVTQAAALSNCEHTSTTTSSTTWEEIYYHTYTANSVTYNCRVTVPHIRTVTKCTSCGVTISTTEKTETASHQYNH